MRVLELKRALSMEIKNYETTKQRNNFFIGIVDFPFLFLLYRLCRRAVYFVHIIYT